MESLEIIKFFLKKQLNIHPDALQYIKDNRLSISDIEKILLLIPSDIMVITKELLIESLTKITEIDDNVQNDLSPEEIDKKTVVSQQQLTFKVLTEIPDSPNDPLDPNTFKKMFINRFKRLYTIIVDNLTETINLPHIQYTVPPDKIPTNRRGFLIGIVQETSVLSSKNFVIVLEDIIEGIVKCIFSRKNPLLKEFLKTPRDSVIGVSGRLFDDFKGGKIKFFFGEKVILPSFKPITYPKNQPKGKIIFVGDVPSNRTKDKLTNLSKIINSLFVNIKNENNSLLSDIKAIFFLGNLVINTNHYNDSVIDTDYKNNTNIKKLYDNLSKILQNIPEHIKIFIMPDDNIGSLYTIPQPPIKLNLAKSLYNFSNIEIISNPCYLKIDDVLLLVYNGKGLNYFFENVLRQKTLNPIEGIKTLFEYRILNPEYGVNPWYLTDFDYTVIDPIPHIFITMFACETKVFTYKGIKNIITTSFSKEGDNDIITSLKIPMIELSTGETTLLEIPLL